MRHVSTRNTGLHAHMTRYTVVDAKMDNPHRTERECRAIVRESRVGNVPLVKRMGVRP